MSVPGTAITTPNVAADEKRRRFEIEVLPHVEGLYPSAFRLTRNPDDAADLVQETFLRAFAGFESFESGSNLRAWLQRILMNAYISMYRKARVRPKTVSVDENDEFSLYEVIASTGQEPEAAVLDRLADGEVEAAVDALPEEFRIAVLLADVEGFRYQEIADITGVPVATVTTRLHRGRKLLQRALWDYARRRGLVDEAKS